MSLSHQVLFLISILIISCQPKKQKTLLLEGSPSAAEIFGDDVISTGLYERDIAISPDGLELIYTLGDNKQNRRCLIMRNNINGTWSGPEMLNISGQYDDIEPFYTNEGNRLFFASNRPIYNDKVRKDYNIWYCDRTLDGWGAPKALSKNVNTTGDEFYPSLGKTGNLYFTATRENGIGREDIFIAELENGVYLDPVPLDTLINSVFYEFNAFINPDENLIIFTSYGRSDDKGGGDLYFSIKDKHGNWTKARNMGNKVNSKKLDYCPFIDYAHQNFYFTSERTKEAIGPFSKVEDLLQFANGTQNGFGDIYRIGLKELNLSLPPS